MATEVTSGPLGNLRSVATGSGGTALTTTPAFIGLIEGSRFVQLIPRNFATAIVVQLSLCPYLLILKRAGTFTAANTTAYSSEAQDGDTATYVVLSSLAAVASSHFLYVGSMEPFRGVYIDVDQTNSTASVLTVKYWNGSAWADITATDNTASPAGTTFGQDGTVVWTVPTAWATASLVDTADVASGINAENLSRPGVYWTRWEVSVALDASVRFASMLAMNESTAYAELPAGTALEFSVANAPGGYAGVEARTDAGTANLIVNVATRSAVRFT